MQFLALAALFLATASAAPSTKGHGVARRAESWCPDGLYANPQCCGVDVLGVADLDCVVPSEDPSKCKSFGAACAKDGRQAKCCVAPVAGQALLCIDPVPTK